MKPSFILEFIFLIFLLGCSKNNQVIDQDRLLVISRSFSSQGGRMALCNSNGDSAILEIPADALSGENTITMKILDIPPQCPISDIVFPGLILEPENLVFDKTIRLRIKFSESMDQADRIRIFNITPDNEINFIETQKISDSQLVGKIMHFSSYLAGKPSYDEICTLMDQIVVYGGDADAFGILEILQDVYNYFSQAETLDVLGQSEKANEAREHGMGYLEEKTYEILDYIPIKSCGQYQISLDYLLQVLEVYLGTSDVTKLLKVKVTELENKCKDDDLNCDDAKVRVSPGNIQITEGNQYPIDLEYEAAANGKTYIPVIKFFSLNRNIATVNSDGIIKGIKKGLTTIFVRWCEKSFDINVEVEELDYCDSANVKVNSNPIYLNIGDTNRIVINYYETSSGNLYVPKVTFTSTNNSIASVNSDGIIRAISKGEASIIVEWCDTTVTIPIAVEGDRYIIDWKATIDDRKVENIQVSENVSSTQTTTYDGIWEGAAEFVNTNIYGHCQVDNLTTTGYFNTSVLSITTSDCGNEVRKMEVLQETETTIIPDEVLKHFGLALGFENNQCCFSDPFMSLRSSINVNYSTHIKILGWSCMSRTYTNFEDGSQNVIQGIHYFKNPGRILATNEDCTNFYTEVDIPHELYNKIHWEVSIVAIKSKYSQTATNSPNWRNSFKR